MTATERQVQVRRILGLGWEPGDGTEDGAQLVDGDWWWPVLGCDSLQETVGRVRQLLTEVDRADRKECKEPMP
jgi:ribulose bisphosphate carboxylase small subunit